MFKKTIAVLLLFSIVLSSCGKPQKEIVREVVVRNVYVPAESPASVESSVCSVESSTCPVEPLTCFESSVCPVESSVCPECPESPTCPCPLPVRICPECPESPTCPCPSPPELFDNVNSSEFLSYLKAAAPYLKHTVVFLFLLGLNSFVSEDRLPVSYLQSYIANLVAQSFSDVYL